MTSAMIFDFLAVRINGLEAAEEDDLVLQIQFSDRDELWVIDIKNGVLHAREGSPHPNPNLTLEMTRPDFLGLMSGQVGVPALVLQGRVEFSGNPLALATFGGLFDRFDPHFEIARP